MFNRKRSLLSALSLGVLILQLGLPVVAYAGDGDTPPAPPPVEESDPTPAEEAPAETGEADTSAAEATPAEVGEPSPVELEPAEVPPAEPQAPPAEDAEPVPAEAPAIEVEPVEDSEPVVSEEATESEEESVSEVMEALPEDTDLVVLDQNGDPEALATEAAAEIIVQGDPMWCPEGQLPGDAGCTPSFTAFTGPGQLLDFLNTDPTGYSGAGTIFVAADYDNSLEAGDISINGLTGYGITDLTIQGGWDFGSNTVVGTSNFDAGNVINIDNWTGDVSIFDLAIDGASGEMGLWVITTGDIEVEDVSSNNNGAGAYLVSTSGGSNTVTNSTFNHNSGVAGGSLSVISTGDATLTGVTVNNNTGMAASGVVSGDLTITDSEFGGDAATGNSVDGLFFTVNGLDSNVQITGTTASGNGWGGIIIYSTNDVTLTDVTANDNGDRGVFVGTDGDVTLNNLTVNGNGNNGFLHSGDPASITIVNGGTFTGNTGWGTQATGVSDLRLNCVTFGANSSGDYQNPGGTVTLGACEEDGPAGTGSGLPVQVVHANGGLAATQLDCSGHKGTKLMLENGDEAIMNCPTIGKATLKDVTAAGLPAGLPAGASFLSGLESMVTVDGEELDTLKSVMQINFVLPEGMADADLAILHWDGSQWNEVPGWEEGGYFCLDTILTGTFVLVSK